MAVVGDIGLDLTPEGRAAMERLNELADVTIEVGYQADQEVADDETSLAEVAYWNHYGTLHKDGSVMIPARPFMRDITVGEYQFKVRPFGAKDATYIFGDVASIILPILGTVSVASDDKDAVNMEMFDGMDMDKDSLVKALARINGNALSKLVSELLLDHSNIRVLDPEKNTYEVMGEDDFDEIFCQYLAGMLNLCAEVIRLNFSGFFKDASTLFGGLIKVRRAGSSNSTESSTTTE